MFDSTSIRLRSWIEICKQHIRVLMCMLWRWDAVLHVSIIVAVSSKLLSGEMTEIAIFVSNKVRSTGPAMVESNDIARVIIAPEAFANW